LNVTAHEVFLHLGGDFFTELAEVNLAALVAAVLRPHHRIHGEFAGGWASSEDSADLLVLVLFESEFLPGLKLLWSLLGGFGGVDIDRHGLGLD
jgi:hypothetical protein